MSSNGWIKLHRRMLDCWIWFEDDRFSRGQAWVDLLLLANHKDKKILFNGEFIVIKRGQYLTSVRKLSERWSWSVNKTYRFLKLLTDDGMLQKESDNNRTLLTIVNYGVYQCVENTDGNTNEYSDEYTNEYTDGTQTRNKEYKNDKNIKNIKEKDNTKVLSKKKKFAPPTVDEVKQYCLERNNTVNAESFVDFYESKGWMVGKNKMTSWKAAVRTWERANNKSNSSNRVSDKLNESYNMMNDWANGE